MIKHLVIFQPSGKRGYVEEGVTLNQAANQIGEELESICGRKATCGRCVVRIEEGEFTKYGIASRTSHVSPICHGEQSVLEYNGAGPGDRLACAAKVTGDVVVFVHPRTRLGKQIVPKDVVRRKIDVVPAIHNYYVQLNPATLDDALADWERLQAKFATCFDLAHLQIDYSALQSLQEVMRAGDWGVTATVWMGMKVIRVQPGWLPKSYGLAVDIGTTTIAGYLCDLEDGGTLATASQMNPQLAYGEDVMSRITYAETNPGGLSRLHRVIIDALNGLAGDIVAQAGLTPTDIVEVVLVGNTVMHHLLLNLSPAYLGCAPFIPAVHHSVNIPAREIGLSIHPGANVHVLPIEAGFVGADNVGVLIAEEPHKQDEKLLIIDIGTNGELVLGDRERLVCASCACGPALEGGNIRFGMRAAAGVIERVRIDPQTWEPNYYVIGRPDWRAHLRPEEIQAQGICGSGVIEVVAEMLATGIIDQKGRFNTQVSHERIKKGEQGMEYVLAWAAETSAGIDITLSQKDIQAFTLAKAAIYSGCKLLLKKLGLDRPDKIILAGAFGSIIDPMRAMAIGLFPRVELDRIYSAGNAAGEGARLALLNVHKRVEADGITRWVQHVELTLESDFQEEYTLALHLPHARDR